MEKLNIFTNKEDKNTTTKKSTNTGNKRQLRNLKFPVLLEVI
jgi:hypothetical protein